MFDLFMLKSELNWRGTDYVLLLNLLVIKNIYPLSAHTATACMKTLTSSHRSLTVLEEETETSEVTRSLPDYPLLKPTCAKKSSTPVPVITGAHLHSHLRLMAAGGSAY